MNKKYKKYLTRECSLIMVKGWYKGDLDELMRWVGFSFSNTIYESKDGWVAVYYDEDEDNGDKFHEILQKKLTGDMFNEVCDYFFEMINKSQNVSSDEEILDIFTKLHPVYTIFDEISRYPKIATDDMMRRIIRVRKTTESFAHNLDRKVKDRGPKDYVFYKGELYFIPFEQFIKENGFEVVK
ncbi:hypothetical protein HY448_02835 [Candidatus Pacearchaeota archaeon]|nr:hypothetical protein [Candidatus Pacearchaeota archaeon]